VDYNYPHDGSTNNAVLAVKDYETRGIIFVKSSEVVDGNGDHTGSKITYEMLMTEAQKLDADDVINIKIDVNQKEEIVKDKIGNQFTRTTYNYTASALAIKYTAAIPVENRTNTSQDIGNTMVITKTETKSTGKIGIVLGILAGVVVIIGAAYLLSNSGNSNNSSY